MYSGLDKDLDQWVFHPLLFNLMSILLHILNIKLQKMQNLVKRPNYLLKSCLYQIHVAFLGKLPPYRNENVAALELQYCGSRAAIKF